MLDKQALSAYRRRLAEIDADLDEARSWADTGRAAKLAAERDALLDQVRAATGLGGRPRVAGSARERARIAVRKAIVKAIDRVAAADLSLGRLLSDTVTTGAICHYDPDPDRPVHWDGQRRWQVYRDKITTGPAELLPRDIRDLADPSWLLRCWLSGGATVAAGGRAAYRINAARRPGDESLSLMFPAAVAAVDADLGLVLRLTCYIGARPVQRRELRDLTSDIGEFTGPGRPAPATRSTEPSDGQGKSRDPACLARRCHPSRCEQLPVTVRLNRGSMYGHSSQGLRIQANM